MKRIFLFLCSINLASTIFANNCQLDDLNSLNINSFDYCSQDELDNFYRSLTAGKLLPNGFHQGAVQLGEKKHLQLLNEFSDLEKEEIHKDRLERFMERLWKGKVFYTQNSEAPYLYNKIFGKEHFPAHVYWGDSLFDTSKDSIIIDYSHNQDIKGYRPLIDWLVNENGLEIRDEIRTVRPDLYLGRAYVKGKFLLNFVLEK